MKRIFQDVKGKIEELSGKTVSSLYSLNNLNEGGISLIWLGTTGDKYWYRIFIDGWYCGVDRFEECNIEEDKDEGFEIVSHNPSLIWSTLLDICGLLRVSLNNSISALISIVHTSE